MRSFKIITMCVTVVLGTTTFFSTAFAADADEFAAAKQIIANRVACQQLSVTQLEQVGDYIMEQMAPGAQHTQMEQMMGGEGSESLRQAHIFMARRWYCGDAAGYGMMGMMMGGYGYAGGFAAPAAPSYGMMGGAYSWPYYGAGMGLIMFLSVLFFAIGTVAILKYLFKK